jgi:hypothetical protein
MCTVIRKSWAFVGQESSARGTLGTDQKAHFSLGIWKPSYRARERDREGERRREGKRRLPSMQWCCLYYLWGRGEKTSIFKL